MEPDRHYFAVNAHVGSDRLVVAVHYDSYSLALVAALIDVKSICGHKVHQFALCYDIVAFSLPPIGETTEEIDCLILDGRASGS